MPDAITMYQDGKYLELTGGTWDLDDAPFKAAEVLKMIAKHNLQPSTVCDIGCGAGGVLREMQRALAAHVRFTGYDVSLQALEIGKQFANERCEFLSIDPFTDGKTCDIALAMDVFEHVEDCYAFLRHMRTKSKYKIYHVPLEVHASAALRGVHGWAVGHLHQFTRETALKTIEHCDQEIVDYWFTGPSFSYSIGWNTKLTHLVRRSLAAFAGKQFSSRLLGGYSLLVLAR